MRNTTRRTIHRRQMVHITFSIFHHWSGCVWQRDVSEPTSNGLRCARWIRDCIIVVYSEEGYYGNRAGVLGRGVLCEGIEGSLSGDGGVRYWRSILRFGGGGYFGDWTFVLGRHMLHGSNIQRLHQTPRQIHRRPLLHPQGNPHRHRSHVLRTHLPRIRYQIRVLHSRWRKRRRSLLHRGRRLRHGGSGVLVGNVLRRRHTACVRGGRWDYHRESILRVEGGEVFCDRSYLLEG
mmetsp:Transcript_13911/g.29802  ORF Transcript_13911/g.29802 Transcript_13911/m.29802 type:complete len:234 (+) Transcript_13911:446-1147(+)